MRTRELASAPPAREDWALRHLGNYATAFRLAVLDRHVTAG